jgi:S-adenosylmethionine:tRNA ribosyltransferase-isomerase
MRPSYPLARLDYDLPQELIAQHPLPERTGSRMLHVDVSRGEFTDRRFADLPELQPPGTLAVFNNSRVIPARLSGRRQALREGQGGGRVEVLYNKWLGDGQCEAIVGSNAVLTAGESIELPGGWTVTLEEPKALNAIRVTISTATGEPATHEELLDYLDQFGATPLPPYIKRGSDTSDEESSEDSARYQTVYARPAGSVAAPTAGLHFDGAMLGEIDSRGVQRCEVTLHVGYGTFAPVRVDDLRDHRMHAEECSVSAEACRTYFDYVAAGRPVAAVGTTSLRILHTLTALNATQREAACGEGWHGATDAFIYPGHGTSACDLLLTNFHLPRSTLLALVYAVGGEDLMRRAYEHAVGQRYRFFSYGDCMLIDRGGRR